MNMSVLKYVLLTWIEWAHSLQSPDVVVVPVGDDDLADSSFQLL